MRKLFIVTALCIDRLFRYLPRQMTLQPKRYWMMSALNSKHLKQFRPDLVYKVEDAKGKVMSTKTGTIWMKGTKYKVSFGGQEIFSDGTTVWNYDKSAKEVTISNVDASGSGITPQKLFTNFYDKDFLYILNGEKKIGSKTLQEIEMTPTDKSKNFHKVYLQIDKAAKTIYSTKVLENAGNKYTYTVSSMKTNSAMADNLFVFDKKKYPGSGRSGS